MAFTDDKLERLKAGLATTDYPFPIKELVARLEAAETAIKETVGEFSKHKAVQAWRKEAGK